MLALKNLFLPIFCKQCDMRMLTEENGFFCPSCWEAIPFIERPFCTRCGRPHATMMGLGMLNNFPCADCRETANPAIRRIYGATQYDGAVKDAIKLLKFQGKIRLAPAIAELMANFAQREMEPGQYDLLVPVPLHKVRYRARGYNQSVLLAQALVQYFPGAVVDESLIRIRPTRTQSKLKGPARQGNVRGAFAVTGDTVREKTVLLVDDVVTSAGTVTECSLALKRAGAATVDVFAAALSKQPSF